MILSFDTIKDNIFFPYCVFLCFFLIGYNVSAMNRTGLTCTLLLLLHLAKYTNLFLTYLFSKTNFYNWRCNETAPTINFSTNPVLFIGFVRCFYSFFNFNIPSHSVKLVFCNINVSLQYTTLLNSM